MNPTNKHWGIGVACLVLLLAAGIFSLTTKTHMPSDVTAAVPCELVDPNGIPNACAIGKCFGGKVCTYTGSVMTGTGGHCFCHP